MDFLWIVVSGDDAAVGAMLANDQWGLADHERGVWCKVATYPLNNADAATVRYARGRKCYVRKVQMRWGSEPKKVMKKKGGKVKKKEASLDTAA